MSEDLTDLNSCIYEGWVRHRRFQPKNHSFEYKLFYAYIDLDELDELMSRTQGFSRSIFSPIRFKRSDYMGPHELPLKESVLGVVARSLGYRPKGPVRMLTHLRYLGFCFNPVTFYYCFDEDGTTLEAIAAEINNTPWDERFTYVLCPETNQHKHRFHLQKSFHVSPFFPMEMTYDWSFVSPGEQLNVHMRNMTKEDCSFDATLSLKRRPWHKGVLLGAIARYPLLTFKVSMAIYFQALRLWFKRIPFYSHPNKQGELI